MAGDLLFFRISLDVNFEIQSLPKRGLALTPRRRSDPCSSALLDALRASPRSHPWPDTKSPRFGPNADRVRAAEQPAANAASSAEPRLHRYCPAGRGSNSRLRRPDPAFAYPLACPVSRDTSNPTMPAQPSPRACTHVTSARKWTYYRSAAHQPDLPAGAQGCGRHSHKKCAAPATKRPPLHIAAAAVRCLPRLHTAGAHSPPSVHGVRIPARCARAGPNDGPRAEACCQGAVRSTVRPGGRPPGARVTPRPQAVVSPRLRHLGWPRMRGVAPVRSHYTRIAGGPAGHADEPGLPDPVWRSRRWPMGRRARGNTASQLALYFSAYPQTSS